MRRSLLALLLALPLACTSRRVPLAPRAPRSGALAIARSLADEVGPRLAGSPGDARAVQWALARMRAMGFANVRAEPVTVPHWERGDASAALLSPAAQPLAIAALGGSVPTPDEGIEAEVLEVPDLATLDATDPARVQGRVVFIHQVMRRTDSGEGYGEAVGARTRGPSRAAAKGAVALLVRSIGTDRSRLPHTGALRYQDGVPRIPAAALSVADAAMLHRLGALGPVRVRLRLTCHAEPDAQSANVVGELPGSDRAHEIVLLGAHLDAWDLGRGALDDGAGVAIALESARLAAQGDPLRRTVRVVLFANEENGLAGARAYAQSHADELPRHVAAMEADAGDGRVLSIAFRGGPEGAPTFDALVAQVAPLGVRRDPEPAGGGADLSPLQGVPWIDLAQDMSRYFDIHHTAGDVAEALDPRALDQAVSVWRVVVAALARGDSPLGRRADQ
jgi:hypothetical protein